MHRAVESFSLSRRPPLPLLLAASLLAACSGGGDGGPTAPPPSPVVGAIFGTVTDAEEGTPVAGAAVSTDPATRTVQTDAQGNFRIDGIDVSADLVTAQSAAFEVRAERAGFAAATTTVTLTRSAPEARTDLALGKTLASVAGLRGLPVGTAVQAHLLNETRYREALAREFGSVTPENEMKFGPLRPTRDAFDFGSADAIVDFAEANGMRIHGHVLLWHFQLPDWLTAGDFTRDELIAILREHVTTVVERYRDRIESWDVANEVIADDGSGLREEGFWIREIGPEVIDMVFEWARDADPNAKLYVNEFGVEAPGAKADALFDLVEGLLDRGVPIDGVGIQTHVRAENAPTGADLRALMNRFSGLGLETRITEMDVALRVPASAADLQEQAGIYGDLVEAAVSVPGFAGLTFWGFTDRHSWIPGFFDGFGAATLFDEEYRKKPAYGAVRDALAP